MLNYGQGIFEGMKALKAKNGEIVLFRPEENGKRLNESGKRLLMPSYDVSKFVDAVKQALDRKYTDNQLAIPNNLRGMITVYEIMYDDYNYADEVYRFEINAWVGYEPRMQQF